MRDAFDVRDGVDGSSPDAPGVSVGGVAPVAAAVAAAIGTLVLIGWTLDIEFLKRIVPTLPSMKSNTALCLLLSGVALFCASQPSIPRWVPVAFAAPVLLLGGLTLAEYIAGIDVGIDQMLFRDDTGSNLPGRMAPTNAAAFVAMSGATMLLARRRVRTAHALSAAVSAVMLMAVLGYLFGVDELHTISNYTAVTLHTAIAFVALAVSALAIAPREGITGSFVTSGAGRVLTRRLMPVALGVPVVAGWLIVQGERAGLYAHRFGVALVVGATVVLLGLVIAWTAGLLHTVDRQRATAQSDLRLLNAELEERIEMRTFELSESEERFRAVSESAADAVISANEKGQIVYTNTAAANLFGYLPTELEGEPISVLMPERFRAAHRAGIERFLTTGAAKLVGTGPVELVGLHANGTEVPIELSLSSWTARGQTFVTGIIRDVTDRVEALHKLEERETFFRALAENVSDLILRMDAIGKITYASPACRSMLGYEPEELLGLTAADLVPEDGLAEVQRVYGSVFNGESASTQQPILRKDGGRLWMEGVASPTKDAGGVTTGIIWVVRDIQEHLADLDRERDIAQKERELNQLKNEFVGIVAHDLKTPMTVISGFAEIMIQQWVEITDEDKLDFLDRIRDNVTRLSTLVDDVLQVSKIESGEVSLDLRPTDLAGLIWRMVEEHESTSEREVSCDIPPDLPLALIDEDRTWRVITNLVSNALKFSDPDRPVTVSAVREGAKIRASVRDHGDGIPPEDIPKLFQRFSRLQQPRGKNVKGTGLGLYICKQLVEAQGGEIWAESEVGDGTTFHFTVPIAGGVT